MRYLSLIQRKNKYNIGSFFSWNFAQHTSIIFNILSTSSSLYFCSSAHSFPFVSLIFMLLRHSWTPFLHFYPSLIYLHFPFHPPTCHRYNASFPFLFRSPLTRSSLSFPAYLFHSPTACFSPFPISNYIFHYLARSHNSLNPWICYSLIFLNLSCFEYFSWYFLFFISFIILLFET